MRDAPARVLLPLLRPLAITDAGAADAVLTLALAADVDAAKGIELELLLFLLALLGAGFMRSSGG
jgi:hypothetical protein